MLQRGCELLQRMLRDGWGVDDAAARIQFRLHLGDDLLVEAARARVP